MKEESVLDVLMYLFRLHMHEDCEVGHQENKLVEHLEDMGFESNVIYDAFDWLSNLVVPEKGNDIAVSNASTRVFSDYECSVISEECRSFILQLEALGILDARMREIVLSQVIQLTEEGIDLHLVRWVTLIVLFHSKQSEALNNMELLVLGESIGGIH